MPCREIVEIGGALDIFYAANLILARDGAGDPGYAVEVASPVVTVREWHGLRLVAYRSYRSIRGAIDTLIVTGIDGPDDARRHPGFVRWLARIAPRVRRMVGLCTGTFVLAETGLLGGRNATTHWMECDELARRYPTIVVHRDPIYVRDGPICTSAGSTAGLDLILALVQEDLGRRVALQVAQRMVFFLKRPGGQAQFSTLLSTQLAEREPLRDLQTWIIEHPDAQLPVDALARRLAMSPRTLFRVFVREVGMTPGRFVERVRVEAARRLLEESSRSAADIAAACGFGSPETMRLAFRRTLGVSPRRYRNRFAAEPATDPRAGAMAARHAAVAAAAAR
ncbi:MAG: helix-turn-helix domain-containing protein [Candidatus Rokubacteria bacterium]|nr:helix-turn-helix domain-containing protein [Candidatus Rokubacteria bacterium]